MHRLLSSLVDHLLRHPKRVLWLSVGAAMLLAAAAPFFPFDLSFTGIMDRTHPQVDQYFKTQKEGHLGGLLPLLLEGDDDAELEQAAQALKALPQHPSVRDVMVEAPTAWLEDNAPYLVDADLFDAWLRLGTHPEDTSAADKLKSALDDKRSEVTRLSAPGVRIVQVTMERDPFDIDLAGLDFFEVEAETQRLLAPFKGVTFAYAGLPAIAAQDQKNTIGAVQKLTPLTLLLVLLLFRVVERRVSRLLAVAAPMIFAMGATLGVVGMLLGKITIMETFFGIMVFGLGIDFALHLMVRLREELSLAADDGHEGGEEGGDGRESRFRKALFTTLTGTGRGVVAGALTTTGAFCIVGLAPDPGARHMGVSGGVGLFFCLALMLTLLPAVWVLFHRRGMSFTDDNADSWSAKFHASFAPVEVPAHWAASNPKLVLVLTFLVFVATASGISRFHFETDLTKVFNRDVPAVAAMDRAQDVFGINSGPWFAIFKDLDELREVHAKFEKADDVFGRVESAAEILRVDRAERHALLKKHKAEIVAQKTTMEALIPLMSDEEKAGLEGGVKALDVLLRAEQHGPPSAASLPKQIRNQLFAPDGRPLIFAYTKVAGFDAYVSRNQRLAAQAIHPDMTSLGAMNEVMMGLDRPWLLPIFLGIVFFVLVVLAFDLRNLKLMLLAATPVLWATSVTFGILCWAGIPFNVLMTLVVPLIVGLGVDDGIHVVHRMKEDFTVPANEAAASVGRAIFMTTMTTMVSFSTLMFTNHAGMESMAEILLIGLPLCLLSSVTTLPALAVLLGVCPPPPATDAAPEGAGAAAD